MVGMKTVEYMVQMDFPPDRRWRPKDCNKRQEGCFCSTGYPYERSCPECRDYRPHRDIFSYCVCPPPERS